MASARDVIPIALAGLAGALGGRPAAGSINAAADRSRQMNLDKQREEQLNLANERSARTLQLSEEAAKRAQKDLELTESRESRYAERQEKQDREQARLDALVNKTKKEWIEGHPDATQEDLIGIDLMQTPRELYLFDQQYSQKTGAPSFDEVQERTKDLKPGQSISIKLDDGTTFHARGLSEGKAGGIPDYKLQNTIFQGQKDYARAVEKAELDLAKYKDDTDRMLAAGKDAGTAEGTREANLRLQIQKQMEEDLQDLKTNPNREWSFWQENLGSLGLGQEGMDTMRSLFERKLEEEQSRREEAAAAARELTPSEMAIADRAKAAREQAGLPVAEDPALPVEKGTAREIFGQALTPTGEKVVSGIDDLTGGFKKAGENLRLYGVRGLFRGDN